MDDIAQAVVGADLVECDAAKLLMARVVGVGGQKSVAHADPDSMVGEHADQLSLLQLDRVEVMRLAGGQRHDGLVEQEVEDRDQRGDQQHRRRHLEPADTELLAGEHLAAAVEERKSEQRARQTGRRQDLRNDQRQLEHEVLEPEQAEPAVLHQVVEALEDVAEQIAGGEGGDAYDEWLEEAPRQKAIDRR